MQKVTGGHPKCVTHMSFVEQKVSSGRAAEKYMKTERKTGRNMHGSGMEKPLEV